MLDQTTQGYEPDPGDVAALADHVLADARAEPDPSVRYVMLSKDLVLYQALITRIADERARAVAELHKPGGLSYAKIAAALSLGTKARAQQLVERGRALT